MRGIVVVAALMAGCHSAESTALGPNLYSIKANGRDSADLLEDSYEEAWRVCPNGFDVVDSSGAESRDSLVTFDGGKTYTNVHRASSAVIVRCKAPPPQPMVCRRPSCD